MADDNLKEIPGKSFNNSSFDEGKERRRLIPVEPNITPEIQQRFEQYAGSKLIPQWSTRAHVYPDKPAVVYGTDDSVYRAYYWYTGQDPFYPHSRASVEFQKESGRYYPISLIIHGEQPGGYGAEHIMIHFTDLRPEGKRLVDPPGGLRIDASISDRNLILVYDNNGTIRHLAFLPEGHVRHTLVLSLEADPAIGIQNLKDVLQKGGLDLEREGVGHHVVHDVDSDTLNLTISEKGKFRDELKIPVRVAKTEIVDNLFSPSYFDSPFEVDPEEDREWTSLNLGTLGIDWGRTEEAPKPSRR